MIVSAKRIDLVTQKELSDTEGSHVNNSPAEIESSSILHIYFLRIRVFFLRIPDFSSHLSRIFYVPSDPKFRTSDGGTFLS